jgi:ABC-2 type transport system ATP-binding protein
MLDEPTNDVDPVRRRLLWQQVRALADAGSAVLLVTHGVAEAERVVDRLAILHHGRVVAQGTPAELRGSLDDQLRLEVHAASESVAEDLRPPAGAPTVAGRRVVATIAPHEAADAIAWAQRERMAGRVDQFAVNPASLEDVYIGLLCQKEVDRAA